MNTKLNNLILSTDSYKFSHWLQYPQNTTNVFSYIESRGCAYNDKVMMFGLQYFIKKFLSDPITKSDVDAAEKLVSGHGLPFNREGWDYIVSKHKGRLPIIIKAAREGTLIPTKNVMLTIENTDPKCAWLTSYLETILLENIWYPSTVASNTFMAKSVIYDALKKSSDDPDAEIDFKLHCFGYRGVSSQESAAIGNCAHLVNFKGTDTVAGLICAMEYYFTDVCGFSIPASEHSTITIWTEEGELQAYENMVNQYAKQGAMFACVIDSYDTFRAIDMWHSSGLLDRVKEAGATVVLRPDSGDATTIPIQVIQRLMDHVGYTINSKGYKVLPNHVRVIQGDGITIHSMKLIIKNMLDAGLSMSNLAFGMGAGTLQKVDRDSYKFAMKCSSAVVDGVQRDVYKNPVTDSSKQSKRGRLVLVKNDEGVVTKREEEVLETDINMMVVAYNNGLVPEYWEEFDLIRYRAHGYLT
jgi:nicotinamide phosphoribosyltransferase